MRPTLALLLLAAPAFAQNDRPKTQTSAEQQRQEVEAAVASAPVEEREVRSKGSVTVGGRRLVYTATAGTLTIRDVQGKPTASMFYTAYTADGSKTAERPVTFFFNGGPGSPTMWLHMGSFGPVRIRTGNPEYVRPAPYPVGSNPHSLLDKSDLVFLDAIGTGYSRPLGDARPAAFFGVDQDVDAFARAIMRYVGKNARWNSPKFLFGESYGTLRSGALAYQLQDRGMALNGVVLFSSIMNYGYRQPGLDQIHINYLPSYAATAWYHKRLRNSPATVEEVVARARAFAVGPYAAALGKGQLISEAERDQVAQRMGELTGLSPDFLKRANLRVDLPRFQKELLRDRRQVVGRLDSRYVGYDADAAGERPDTDVSSEAIAGAFIAAQNDHITRTLGYETEMQYRSTARGTPGWTWNWAHRPLGGSGATQNTPNTAVDLAAAMRGNPYLKVLSMNGWYDMATPFFGAENDLNHMMLEPAQARNLRFTYYPAGHMMYLNPEALAAMKRDLSAWYDEALGAARESVPPQAPSVPEAGATPPN